MIRYLATNSHGTTRVLTKNEVQLLLLELHGGGYSAKQTANVMADMARLDYGEAVTIKGYTIHQEF